MALAGFSLISVLPTSPCSALRAGLLVAAILRVISGGILKTAYHEQEKYHTVVSALAITFAMIVLGELCCHGSSGTVSSTKSES